MRIPIPPAKNNRAPLLPSSHAPVPPPPATVSAIVNLSAYRFTPLDDLPALRTRLLDLAVNEGLKGTILLSPEGINLFLAAPRPAIDRFLTALRAIPAFADLEPKESLSAHQPFGRLQVKIKREIIAFGVDGIDPARAPAPRLAPETLRDWLDSGRPVTLLDTRNDYEIQLGTFRGALAPGIDHFRDFPQAVRRLPAELRNQPVVTFCTGGIRCEKAAPFLQREGFTNVFQLEGGILKYFETCGGEHFEGECFVFDERVGVDAALRPTGAVLCAGCQRPVTLAEQSSPAYRPGTSCPACHKVSDTPSAPV